MDRALSKGSLKEGRGRSKCDHGKPGKAELQGASEACSQHSESPQGEAVVGSSSGTTCNAGRGVGGPSREGQASVGGRVDLRRVN